MSDIQTRGEKKSRMSSLDLNYVTKINLWLIDMVRDAHTQKNQVRLVKIAKPENLVNKRGYIYKYIYCMKCSTGMILSWILATHKIKDQE